MPPERDEPQRIEIEGKPYVTVEGMALKFRTDAEGWLNATIWIDNEPRRDIGRAHVGFLGPGGGSPEHEIFVRAMSRLFDLFVENRTGVQLRTEFRRVPKPGHENERSSAQGGGG